MDKTVFKPPLHLGVRCRGVNRGIIPMIATLAWFLLHGFNKKNRKKISYISISSAIRFVRHSENFSASVSEACDVYIDANESLMARVVNTSHHSFQRRVILFSCSRVFNWYRIIYVNVV